MQTHIVYAGYYYEHESNLRDRHLDILRSFIQQGVEEYDIDSVMLTSISMCKSDLITKEKMMNYCLGNEKRKDSINDDLESLFEDLRNGKEVDAYNKTYYLPMLTQQELNLVDRKDVNYLDTFSKVHSDVDEAEMKLSESESKFARNECLRLTLTIEHSSNYYWF